MYRKLDLSCALCVGAALALLLLPVKWVFAWILAAAVHELGHMGAVFLCGGEIYGVRFGLRGAEIQTSALTASQELFCALAGPAAGLSLLLFRTWLPKTALFALLQSAYNLLPLIPLDGGRALRCLVSRLPQRAGLSIERGAALLVAALGGWVTVSLALGPVPLAVLAVLIFKAIRPCK